ncbi:MAG: helix-turn-helix domain-containing protein [Bacteroidales bacterium]|nr:helix-turn-helix domain-containing protein [Bacteroidales bacterium]
MAKVIKELTLQNMGHMAGDQHGEYLDSQLLMVMSAMRFGKSFMRTCQPYRIEDGRVLRVISGTAQLIINMKPYYLTTGMMVVMPAGTVMEVEGKDEEFDFQIFSFRDLPADVTFKEDTVLLLSADDWDLMGEYYQLLKHTVSRQPVSMKSVRYIQAAIMSELQSLIMKESKGTSRKAAGRKEEVFHNFADLINQYADKEHNIAFYADRLCLTPNHLGCTIREASGLTVMDWIHRRIIQQAKLFLMYSNLPVGEIAEMLNFSSSSSFCKFFKKETKTTPKQYREDYAVQ